MVDRVLYPKTGKGKKYVRRIRRHRGRTCCDMISEEAQTETQPLSQLLQTYRCDEPQMAGGRHRNAALPDDIADRLHVLQMPASMRDRMLARIPLRRRKQLAARRLARLGKTGPNKGTKRKEPLTGATNSDVGIMGGSRPEDRKHSGSVLNLMVGGVGGGGDGRGHRRAVPRRGVPK